MAAAGNELLVNADPRDATPPGSLRPGPSDPARGEAVPSALGPWLEEMGPRVGRLAMRLLWNGHDAEEIAQEALLAAYREQDRLRDPGKRNTWLYRITINLAHNRARRRRAEPLPPDLALTAPRDDAGRARGGEGLMDHVREAVMELPERQHAAIVLRDMEGLEYEQIAAILGVRGGAVRILVHRAREAVRETVARKWPECLES